MEDKLLLKLTSTQRQLLLKYKNFIMNKIVMRAISVALKMNNNYHAYLDYENFKDLVSQVAVVANHEKGYEMADETRKLADYIEDCFEKFEL